MKCRLSKCNAQCCYNLSFDQNELERFASRIVNPVLYFVPLFGRNVAFTAEKMEDNNVRSFGMISSVISMRTVRTYARSSER